MGEIIAELLLLWEDLKFWKKKKARRKFEKENNLPKKFLIHPSLLVLLIAVGFIIIVRIAIGIFYVSDNGLTETTEQINEIVSILEQEKSELGIYPQELKNIIRNNPLRQNITSDLWNNEFHYEQLDNGQSYVLKSKGQDGILGTEDDIDGRKNLP
jgi:general secretion pathway protein G